MERGARKLLQALNPVARRAAKSGPSEASLLPMLPGRRFEGTQVAMNARDLVERLCYERFTGCVYLQSAGADNSDEAGMYALVIIEGDRATGALWGHGGRADLMGQAAWERIKSLREMPECLALGVEPELLECYSALMGDCVAEGASASEKRLREVDETFRTMRATGLIRVAGSEGQRFEFYRGGQSHGLFDMNAQTGDLSPAPRGSTLLGAASNASWTQRAKLDAWVRQPLTLHISGAPLSAAPTRALAAMLALSVDLVSHLMPAHLAAQAWGDAFRGASARAPFFLAWPDAGLLPTDFTSSASPLSSDAKATARRAQHFEKLLKSSRAQPEDIAQACANLADAVLEPVARAVGPRMFAREMSAGLGQQTSDQLRELGALPQVLAGAGATPQQANESAASPGLSAATDPVSSSGLQTATQLRFARAPRRVKAENSSYDF